MSEIRIIMYDAEHKRELFGLIGEACTSATVHRLLGNPIVSAKGDCWIIAVDDAGELTGMCCLSPSKTSIKLHGLYANDNSKLLAKLRSEACKQAKKMGAKELVITDRVGLRDTYEHEGWQVVGPRGKNYLAYRKDISP